MLRNIPNKFTQVSLIEEINAEGFSDTYDFFYLPIDVKNQTNVGYCFVNFTTSANMKKFQEHFQAYQFKKHPSQKIAAVMSAHVQGLEGNIRQLAKKAVTTFENSEWRPIILRNGVRVEFEDVAKEMGVSLQ